MKIGIVGLGMVGEAVAFGLRRINHEVIGFDIDPAKGAEDFDAVCEAHVAFICVPTPNFEGRCDTRAVEQVVTRFARRGYPRLLVIKSTVPPGTTDELQGRFPNLRLAFCPEFLRERARFSDFVENQDVCIAGVYSEKHADLLRVVHGPLPKHFVAMKPKEAELAKYFVNCFNAYRINFANAFADVCKQVGADYKTIKDAVVLRGDTRSSYLESNEQTRAFGGACLPKDTQAFARYVQDLGLLTGLFNTIVTENDRVKNSLISYKYTKRDVA